MKPTLTPGDIVIIDSLSAHKFAAVRYAAATCVRCCPPLLGYSFGELPALGLESLGLDTLNIYWCGRERTVDATIQHHNLLRLKPLDYVGRTE